MRRQEVHPKFVMKRPTWPAERTALDTGQTVRDPDRWMGLRTVYVPVRVKPRYWTSQVRHASVIHIATGRGLLIQGTVATRGQIHFEPYCNGHLEWPRALSSPADFPDRRLCSPCLENAHTAEVIDLPEQDRPPRTITVHITAA